MIMLLIAGSIPRHFPELCFAVAIGTLHIYQNRWFVSGQIIYSLPMFLNNLFFNSVNSFVEYFNVPSSLCNDWTALWILWMWISPKQLMFALHVSVGNKFNWPQPTNSLFKAVNKSWVIIDVFFPNRCCVSSFSIHKSKILNGIQHVRLLHLISLFLKFTVIL